MARKLAKQNPSVFQYEELMKKEGTSLTKIYERVFGKVTVVKDTRDFDSKGNAIDYEPEENEREIVEPYDPAYTDEEEDKNPCVISAKERRFLRKISILENKLKRNKIGYEWDSYRQRFEVARYAEESEYPTYAYLWVDMSDNTYNFGTSYKDSWYDEKVGEIIDITIKWLGNEQID